MKILKLLNKKYFSILFCFLFLQNTDLFSNEPVDIWNLESKENLEVNSTEQNNQDESISQNSVYNSQSEKNNDFIVELDETLKSKEIEIVGIYDPSENSVTIDMWRNSDGRKILDLFNKVQAIELSKDSKEILNILLLTNSYFPSKNISNVSIKNDKSLVLSKGQRALIESKNAEIIHSSSTNNHYPGWLNNKIICDNTSLDKICKEIERTYNIKILFKDISKKKVSISGIIDLYPNNLKSVISSISLLADLEFKLKGDAYIVL